MAIRYSGDVEARMSYAGKRRYDVVVRWPGGRVALQVPFSGSGSDPTASETYDDVAKKAIGGVRGAHRYAELGTFGGVKIRRLFQAPCPVRAVAGDASRRRRRARRWS